MDFPVSEGLDAVVLTGHKMRETTVGADVSQRMKWANEILDQEGDNECHSPSGGEELRPNMKPGRLRIVRARPFLAVIEGGRN